MDKLKNKKVLISIVLVLVIISFIAFWVPRTPEYSLYQVSQAFVSNDYNKFQKYVDTESIVNEFVENTISQSMKQINPSSPWEQLGAQLAMGFIEAKKPQLIERFRVTLKEAVENGYQGDTFDSSRISVNALSFILLRKAGDYKLTNPKIKDKDCKIGIIYKNETTYIRMTNKDNRWIVTSIELDEPLQIER